MRYTATIKVRVDITEEQYKAFQKAKDEIQQAQHHLREVQQDILSQGHYPGVASLSDLVVVQAHNQ
jgi:hypothetical protein